MRLIKPSSLVEYRDPQGRDHDCHAEVWRSHDERLAIVVLRNLVDAPGLDLSEHGKLALARVQEAWLPFIAPDAQVQVLVMRAGTSGKARARIIAA